MVRAGKSAWAGLNVWADLVWEPGLRPGKGQSFELIVAPGEWEEVKVLENHQLGLIYFTFIDGLLRDQQFLFP